eukprot:2789035-Rhodomonas_salina.1
MYGKGVPLLQISRSLGLPIHIGTRRSTHLILGRDDEARRVDVRHRALHHIPQVSDPPLRSFLKSLTLPTAPHTTFPEPQHPFPALHSAHSISISPLRLAKCLIPPLAPHSPTRASFPHSRSSASTPSLPSNALPHSPLSRQHIPPLTTTL